ncbi:Redoxin [Neoconidiobolus thromboides FSU 785]|nr:Redoxin [Neoconidiobolus thromboides FSU 785]
MKSNLQQILKQSQRLFQSSTRAFIKVGQELSTKSVHLNSPATEINLFEHFKQYPLAILFGVPGAFTPGCSKSHLPSYLENYEQLKQKGVEEIACLSVNDAFVMQAWGEANNTDKKITMFADVNAEAVKDMDLQFDLPDIVLGGIRSKRFAMILKNGKVDQLFVEPDNTGLSNTLAKHVLEKL